MQLVVPRAVSAAVLVLGLQETVHVDELALLDELSAGDVFLGG